MRGGILVVPVKAFVECSRKAAATCMDDSSEIASEAFVGCPDEVGTVEERVVHFTTCFGQQEAGVAGG